MYQLLSHTMSTTDPAWPGEPTLKVEAHSLIERGDNADTYVLHLYNHFGTHIDAPKHFNPLGKRISKFPISTFVFNKPLLLDIPKNMGEILAKEELIQYRDKIREADLLLIRSGTYQWKQQKPLEFASRGPALHSEAARYLMEEFPSLRAIGVDWLSIASPSFMPDGIYTHQYLLGRFHDHHLFIIEDLNLKDLDAKRLLRVFAFPLLVEGIDSAPATVVAEVTT